MVKVCRVVQCIVSCCGSTSQTRLSAIEIKKQQEGIEEIITTWWQMVGSMVAYGS